MDKYDENWEEASLRDEPEEDQKLTWDERIDRAYNNGGKFTVFDKLRANSWTTCDVGEKRLLNELGVPNDRLVDSLGMAFFYAVEKDSPDGADYINRAIGHRLREIDAASA